MRLDLRFAVLLLAVAGACTTDDSGTGQNAVKLDNSEPTKASEDGGGQSTSTDAKVSKPVVDSGTDHSEDASLPAAEDGAVADASPSADAGEPVDKPDASEPVLDAGAPDDASVSGRCGTRGGVQCKVGEFCDFGGDPACGATDKGGSCSTASKICPQIYAPVCGCDSRSYSSECAAHAAGASVMHEDACTAAECTAAGGEVKASNGANIPKCGGGQESWSLSGGIEPVICCLGKVTTPDPVDPGICGGIAGFKCDPGEFCNYEPPKGDGCIQIADGAGKCETAPQACTAVYDPVCGCNGVTFSSACNAHAAGVSVKVKGPCK